ncbi:MAG: nucleotidyltransferase family protein [Anaerolineales bacterium]|nr:nucleotidyltransferase family protein [Anaerolineales bacterium]MDW8448152.1 nucleotidyltransferase family protein [Anaerolineales bacterium]
MVGARKETNRYLLSLLSNRPPSFPAEIPSTELWQELYGRAEQHRVAPLVYWKLRQGQSVIPSSVFDRFKHSYLTTLARNRVLLAELDRIVQLLVPLGVQVVLLKGMVFVRTLYEDIGLRPMSDLDILLHKGDIPKAVWILKQNGYEEPILHQSELLKQDVTHDVHLRQTQPPYLDLEVHWLLVSGERFRHKTDMDWFWRRIMPLQGWQEGVYTLSPVAHLLYLCGHLGYQHGLGTIGLLWLVDIARFLKKYEAQIDWEDFVVGAKHLSWSAAAYYTFRQVQKYLFQSPPTSVMERLRLQMTAEEEKHVLSMSVVAPSRVLFAWKQFQQLDNAARVRNIVGRLFPSLAFMRERYGFRSNWQAILGYPVRWADLTQVFLKYLWSKAKGKPKSLTD